MKKILKSLFAAGLMLVAVGCNQDQIATQFNPAGEDASTAWFAQSAISQTFSTTATGEQTINVDIYRQSAEGELHAGLWWDMGDGAEEFLSFPESVYFADGELKTVVPITVSNVENFSKGTTYTVTIGVGDYHEFKDIELENTVLQKGKAGRAVDTDKYSKITVSTTLELNWEACYTLKDFSKLLATDLTEEDYVKGADGKPLPLTATWTTGFYDAPVEGIVIQRANGTNVFRMVAPFTEDGSNANLIFTIDTNPDHLVNYNGAQYFRVVITPQSTGVLASSYGEDYCMADYVSYQGGGSYDDYPSFWNGGRTIAFVNALHISLGYFYVQMETIVFDMGAMPDPKPEVTIEYKGVSTSETGIKSYELAFTPNADAAKYFATVLPFDIESEIPLSPEQIAQAQAMAEQACIDALTNDIIGVFGYTPGSAEFQAVYDYYLPVYMQDAPKYYQAIAAEMAAGLVSEYLAEVQAQIEAGTFESEMPVLERDAASNEAWAPSAAGMYTAVAFSYDKSGKFSGVDYKLFYHNPEANPAAVRCEYTFDISNGEYTAPGYAWGLFNDNAIYVDFYSGVDITGVKYATLTAEEFAAAGFTDASTDADYIAYLAESGKTLGAADLADVNDVNGEDAYFYTFIAAQPATQYYLIAAISDADATKVIVDTVTTEAQAAGSFNLVAGAINSGNYFAHTHVIAQMTGSHVCGADYLVAAASSFKNYLVKNEYGSFSLAEGVTNEDIVALVEKNGSALTSGYSSSAASQIQTINEGEKPAQIAKAVNKPNTEFYVVACYDLTGEGCKNWVAKSVMTAFAPAVAFTQSVAVDGNNLLFNWTAQPTASIFAVEAVHYALVKAADLVAAGVDLTKIADNDLNNFAAQLANGGDEAALTAAAANAEKIMTVLVANMKTLEGDAAVEVNTTGITKQFTNLAAGEYALISYVEDSYNSKLTVSLATIQ